MLLLSLAILINDQNTLSLTIILYEKVDDNLVIVRFVSSHSQLADIFMKILDTTRFNLLRSKLLVQTSPSLVGVLTENFSHNNRVDWNEQKNY